MPCLNNATCIDLIANYTCSCPSGFTGLHCESRIDYCGEANCTQNGVCVNLFTGKSHSKAWILCNRSHLLVASIDFSLHEGLVLFRIFRSPQWALSSSIAPIGTWQLNSHIVQKHLAREKKAQWDPPERMGSRILSDVFLLFFLAPLRPILSGKAFLSHATV